MYKKKVIVFSTILIILLITSLMFLSLNSNQIKIDLDKSYIKFKGYALNGMRFQSGKFNNWDIQIISEENKIKSINLTIDANSLDTDLDELDKNLRSVNFLEVENYPTIIFYSESITDTSITGILTFKGITKQIEIPVEITQNSITIQTNVDVSRFGEDYGVIDENIEISSKLILEDF